MRRECGTCTKCCEGYVSGQVRGIPFYNGKPCHFVNISVGCSSYKDRPKKPCQEYECMWLVDPDIPEWMKPDKVNAIIEMRVTKEGIPYINVLEAGQTLSAKVLSWIFEYAIKNSMNLCWEIEKGKNLIGSKEFLFSIKKEEIKN